ncbi:hypothetical protein SAMN04488123_11032 [Natribacillus halophilus]|uniref:Uncharacterized protein n=2 Tax=Bacillaceae TaxID=186817 RepID=A0A1G8PZU6_9BACI|nr:hypothetical protein SAMN04488123_11032 [Natribacillus halophilus]
MLTGRIIAFATRVIFSEFELTIMVRRDILELTEMVKQETGGEQM